VESSSIKAKFSVAPDSAGDPWPVQSRVLCGHRHQVKDIAGRRKEGFAFRVSDGQRFFAKCHSDSVAADCKVYVNDRQRNAFRRATAKTHRADRFSAADPKWSLLRACGWVDRALGECVGLPGHSGGL
jgi:hypothetical protein